MEDTVPFGSQFYFVMLGLLAFSRGMDILSTRVATPNLVLEGNPIARKLGWTWNILISVVFSIGFACWPLPAIVISTSSVLVASRNFQQAWLMRSMGEEPYRHWHVARIRETRISLYLFCLFAQTALIAAVGGALIYFCDLLIPVAIGVGIISYAIAVTFFTLLSVWRMRHLMS
ncbi:MAG: hypothetical protein JWQ71_537 [Pedosphaera sp.]|nr:hypothetical protein [Pedosphaera sp.]